MKKPSHSMMMLLLLICSGFCFAADGQRFLEKDFVLNQQQKLELANQALDGSGKAALRLSRFYSNVTLNFDEALKWALVGAENGDLNSEYTVYGLLSRRESPDDQRRAMFWLRRAASQGYEPAVHRLKNSTPGSR